MSSFENKYYLRDPTSYQCIKRDLSLLIDSAKFFLVWLFKGYLIRRKYRQAQEQDTYLFLDDLLEDDRD